MYTVVSMVLIPVVNEHDEIIGYKERSEITREDIYRVSVLRLTNSQGDVFLKQRARTKSNNPGKREAAVAGTVEKDESYHENIMHESKEELGVRTEDFLVFEEGPKLFVEEGTGLRFFGQVYHATIDLPLSAFQLEEGQAEQMKRWKREELEIAVENTPSLFTPRFELLLTL